MTTFTKIKPYNNDWISSQGWGCGYVYIPCIHPILIKREFTEGLELMNFYAQGFKEEITYLEEETINDNVYIVIGFDTRHSWHDSNYDKNWVQKTASELKRIIDNYTIEDAKKELEDHLDSLRQNLINEYF